MAYAPPEALPDGTTLVRWTGFVADGEAVIGPDGLLRRVRIEDHQEADGRTAFRTRRCRVHRLPGRYHACAP